MISQTNKVENSKNKRTRTKFARFKKLLFSRLDLTPTEIAWRTHRCKNRQVASALACTYMREIGVTHQDLMEREGLSDEQDIRDLKRLSEAKKLIASGHLEVDKNGKKYRKIRFKSVDDHDTQEKALQLRLRIKGKFAKRDDEFKTGNNVYNIVINRMKESDTEELVDLLDMLKKRRGLNVANTE